MRRHTSIVSGTLRVPSFAHTVCGLLGLALSAVASTSSAREITVGPDKEYSVPESVPWEALTAGDVVTIHWRKEPYHAKWVVACRGTVDKPVKIRGAPGPSGELPVIDADGAVTPRQLDFWSGARGIIKIGGSNNPPNVMPAYIIIEGLDLRGARPGKNFLGRDGLAEYSDAASAIFIEKGEHITVRSCRMHDCANGFFTAPETSEILVEGCTIFDNGIEGSVYQHNSYTESAGVIFQFNRFGPLRVECGGSNLKDRSAGTVVRYNVIDGGNRQIDLVEAQEGATIREDARYRQAYVYGNVLIERDGADNNQIVHFGGDSGPEEDFRTGPLWFYHNTVISRRTGTTTLLRLSTSRQSAEVFDNLVFVDGPGSRLAILDEAGSAHLDHNWLKPGWKGSHGDLLGEVNASENVESDEPQFLDAASGDFRLRAQSKARDAGRMLPGDLAERHPVLWEMVPPQSFRKRPSDGKPDLGAFELP
jgi:hypothetical protein